MEHVGEDIEYIYIYIELLVKGEKVEPQKLI